MTLSRSVVAAPPVTLWPAVERRGQLPPDLEVTLPFNNPTKVVFGGKDMKRLFITSMSLSLGLTNPLELDGGLFAFEPGVAGLAETMLKI